MFLTPSPSWQRVQGDVRDTLTVRLDGVADLLGVTGVYAVVSPTGTATTDDDVILAASVVDAVGRVVQVELGGSDGWLATAAPGVYDVEVVTEWAAGERRSFPEGRPATVTVRRRGARQT